MKTRITLSQLEFSCLIGVFDPERITPQKLRVDVSLELDGQGAAIADRLEQTWNYDALADQIGFILKASHFYLLESAAHVIARWILLPQVGDPNRPQIERVSVRLSKPAALPGAAQAIVVVEAEASAQHYDSECKSWGTVDIVEETRRMGLYRLTLRPGAILPEHHHQRMRETEMVLDAGLEGTQDGGPRQPLAIGQVVAWAHGQKHSYHNTSNRPASLLCMDSPPFDPADEILTGEAS